jgi:catechol 2,3-dioxygenase-like lactoylglutathione lyase family enzyme
VGTPPPSIGAITLFVEDLARSTAFYSDVFGLPILFEDEDSAVFRFGGTLVNLLVVPAARDLVRPGVVAGREAGSRAQFTIWVEDVDAACADLATHGVRLINGPMDREWGQRTACFADPAGHIWEFAQELPASPDWPVDPPTP